MKNSPQHPILQALSLRLPAAVVRRNDSSGSCAAHIDGESAPSIFRLVARGTKRLLPLFALLCLASVAHATGSIVQSRKCNTSGTSGNSVSCSFATTTRQGDAILVFGAIQEATAGEALAYEVSDAQHLKYSVMSDPCKGAGWSPTFAYATGTLAAADTVTLGASAGGNNNGGMIIIVEASGLASSSPLDSWKCDPNPVGYSNLYTPPSITTSNADDYILTGITDGSATISKIVTGYTLAVNSNGANSDLGVGVKNVSSTGIQSATFTVSADSNVIGGIAAFKQASAPPSTPLSPDLTISTTSLAGGTVGSTYTATLQASGGTTPYTWSISSGTLPAGLTLNGSSGVISGTPTASGSFAITIQVQDSSSPVQTATKSLTLAITAASISATPSSVSFGTVVTGTTNSQTISLKNTGTANLTVSSAGVSGAGFGMSGLSMPATITPGNSATFSASFDPSATGSVTGSVSVVSNAPGSPLTIPLSGTGAAPVTTITESPTSVSFGNQTVNTTSGGEAVTVTNTGNTSVTVSAVEASAPFAVSGFSSSTTLAPNQNLTLSVTFDPTAQTSYSGSLTITSTASSSPNTVTLSGTGVAQSGLDLTAPNCGITGTGNLIPTAAQWTSWTAPAVGSTYNDGGGFCTVKRITGTGGQMIPFYALDQAINANDTMLLLFNGDSNHWNIYDFSGNIVISGAAFDAATNNNDDLPRWDRTNGDVIWETTGNSIEKCTITTGTPGSISCAITHTFSEYAGNGVGFPADSDMNENGWVPMAGSNGSYIDIFMFQPSTSTKAGTYTLNASAVATCSGSVLDTDEPGGGCLHRIQESPNNGMTIEFENVSGEWQWFPPFSGKPVLWDPTSDHHDTGFWTDGSTVVAVSEDFDYNNTGGVCDWQPLTIFATNTSSPFGHNCPIYNNGSNPGWHVSYLGHATRPWVVMTMQTTGSVPSLYFNDQSGYAAPTSSNWSIYQDEIDLVRIDSTGGGNGNPDPSSLIVYRLAWAHARQNAGYWGDIYAHTSWDGKYVIFSSNGAYAGNSSGCPNGSGFSGDCADTYIIGPLF
jgi:Putative Ig domain/Abnormal spindle-like microcephaly-assoc'd, ASPM-SPD-2-Hydin